MGRAVLAGGIAAVAGGALAVGVAAHTSHSDSAVNINAGVDYFYGAVSSPNERCLPDRKVRVFRKRDGADKLFGAEDSLEETGSYTVTQSTVQLKSGRYYSEIRKRDLRPGPRHAHICRGADSNTIKLSITR